MLFQFKIQIKGLKAPIVWRRLLVPSNFSFHHFHNIIQAAFGWSDIHLSEFSPGGLGVDSFPVITHPKCLPETPYKNSVRFKLNQYFVETGDQIMYTYDYGDGWEHLIKLEKILPEISKRAICIDGSGACPPEDIGGVPGYEDFKIAINDPTHEDYARLREWVYIEGLGWDAHKFNLDRTNRMLKGM
jgi:hypothetical protein